LIRLISKNDFTKFISEVFYFRAFPIIFDAGFGNWRNILGEGEIVAKVVWEYKKAGAVGLYIDNQILARRCGQIDGKAIITANDIVSKMRKASKVSNEYSNG